MKNTIHKIFILTFILAISLPLLLFCFRVKTDVKKGERKISLNFKRNFPLKSELVKVFTMFEEDFFKIDPITGKVMSVDNNWKFLGDDFSNALSESIGKINFTNEELKKIEERLLFREKWLNERNIKMYIAVAPNKHTYYRNLIPLRQSHKKTKMQQLDSLCKKNKINYIDLGADFPKKSDQPLYFKTDTHWNQFAGLYAYNTTSKRLRKDFPDLNCQTYSLKDFDVVYTDSVKVGDLNLMLKKPYEEKYAFLKPKFEIRAKKGTNIYTIPENYTKPPDLYESRHLSTVNNYKLLVFHDSYMGCYQNHLIENFGKTTLIWNHSFNEKIIENEQPDIFYHEILERQIDFLLDY